MVQFEIRRTSERNWRKYKCITEEYFSKNFRIGVEHLRSPTFKQTKKKVKINETYFFKRFQLFETSSLILLPTYKKNQHSNLNFTGIILMNVFLICLKSTYLIVFVGCFENHCVFKSIYFIFKFDFLIILPNVPMNFNPS